jgi:hypothetical protein
MDKDRKIYVMIFEKPTKSFPGSCPGSLLHVLGFFVNFLRIPEATDKTRGLNFRR